ncbi:apoptosis-antagonizing transcription factor, partial [Usnea florida]
MAKGKAPKSWAEQLADLEDPAPRELDPEDDAGQFEEEDGSDSAGNDNDTADARGHYTDVGKSKLRTADGFDLGPQYTGASISRGALVEEASEDDPFGSHSKQEESESGEYADPDEDLDEQQSYADEEIDSDEAFEAGDEKKFAKFTFGSGKLKADGDLDGLDDREGEGSEDETMDDGIKGQESAVEEEDSDSNDAEMDDDELSDGDSDNTSLSNGLTAPKSDDRAALRKMMAEEQKTVAASLSKAAKADVTKGRAIKHQRTTFDSLLNTRIKLQKALIATNSMHSSAAGLNDHPKAIEAAEKATLTLWDTLSELRSSLQPSTSKSLSAPTTTTSTHSQVLWEKMHEFETLNIPKRRANLTKWSQKTNPTTALPRPGKFSQAPSQQPLTSILDQHLSGPNAEKLVQKTHIPRSCAPIQLSSRTPSDPSIYDDADFYTLLLRDLVDQRMADSTTTTTSSLTTIIANGGPNHRSFKVKKPVDTKASKGRKMRYTVHEKLQNFMAPVDLGGWGERQRRELFGGLFGGRGGLREDEGVGMEGEEGDGDEDEDEGDDGMEGGGALRLF